MEIQIIVFSLSLSKSTHRIQQLVKSNILPKAINGNYNLAECIRAYKKYLQQLRLKDKNEAIKVNINDL